MVTITAPASDLLLTTSAAGLPAIPTDAVTKGVFGPVKPWPLIAVHANLLPNGRVLTYGSSGGNLADSLRSRTYGPTQWGIDFDEWIPEKGITDASAHRTRLDPLLYDSFCTTSKMLPDGTLLIASGNGPDPTTALTNPTYSGKYGSQERLSQIWSPGADVNTDGTIAPATGANLTQKRWYASLVRMPDNSVVVVGGGAAYVADAYYTPSREVATYPERFVPGSGWQVPAITNQATYNDQAYWRDKSRWWYPRAYLAPNGKIFAVAGPSMIQIDHLSGEMFEVGARLEDRATVNNSTTSVVGVSNTSVMYAPGRLFFAGGGQYSNGEDYTQPGSRGALTIDINTTDANGNIVPFVQQQAAMQFRRNWGMATVLPDGRVWVDGGGPCGTGARCDGQAVNIGGGLLPEYTFTSELWTPSSVDSTTSALTGTFSPAAVAQKGRVYHQIALLLPNGVVMTGSSGVPAPEDQLNAEFYYPPYLFTTNGSGQTVWADRVRMTSISQTLSYASTFNVTLSDARTISKVSLISTGSVTHGQNNDQRRVPLAFSQLGNTLTIGMPTSTSVLPPGPYMVWVVDSAGVPARAHIVDIKKP